VQRLITRSTAAIMLEPVQGEAGVVPAAPSFLQALRALADHHGLLLILDEVQTGIGRTGSLFAFQQAGIRPDILTLGKGLGGGVPLAALLARADVMCFEPGDQGGTYCGNPLTAAVGYAVLEAVCRPGFLQAVQERSEGLRAVLQRLARRHGGRERGAGLLRAWVLPRQAAAPIVAAARELSPGLLLNAARPDVLRFMPALTVSAEEIEQMGEGLSEVAARQLHAAAA
jgi:acetylornithine/N-succinyldiaminopimelate aminotransferase